MKHNFSLPINSLKSETSLFERLHFDSAQETDLENVTGYKFVIDRRLHRNSVKLKTYITAFRNLAQPTAYLVGAWAELEPHQIFYSPQYATNFAPYPFHDGFLLSFNAHFTDTLINCYLTLKSMNGTDCEIWLEKISVIDSDFDYDKSWLSSADPENIRDIVRPLPEDLPDKDKPPLPPKMDGASPMLPIIS